MSRVFPILALWLAGCALTSNAPPVQTREFTPERLEAAAPKPAASGEPTEIRLGRIRSSANLRRHIVFRVSGVELAEYADLEWTENPEEYARRAVSRALFDSGANRQAVGGGHPILDLELLAFEEVRHEKGRGGRVQISFSLHDEHQVLASGVVTVEKDASASDISAVVVAIGDALEAAAREVAEKVAAGQR
ncbi:MAG TPA: ABC-type transport auxiliary lipoprotein family protein [Polyangiaceae bacterium]|jgi:ABC-type uncharacterized transport system auxiliary subunit|nr:ABC-type transport auxiliary lipoprotein family protein [Polyangiaceae bacterium]